MRRLHLSKNYKIAQVVNHTSINQHVLQLEKRIDLDLEERHVRQLPKLDKMRKVSWPIKVQEVLFLGNKGTVQMSFQITVPRQASFRSTRTKTVPESIIRYNYWSYIFYFITRPHRPNDTRLLYRGVHRFNSEIIF